MAAGQVPTEKEIRAARTELMKYMGDKVLEADQAWASGPQRAEQVIRPEIHHICAQWMNLRDRAWLRGTNPEANATCPNCDAIVSATAATCNACKYILNVEKYEQMKKEGRFAA